MATKTVGNFKLNQQGGYVCRTEFVYLDENENRFELFK